MTREEIEMEIGIIEDEIADLNNQIEILNSMLDDLEDEGMKQTINNKEPLFMGWVCRCWIETSSLGWRSETSEPFETEQEAIDYGIHFTSMLGRYELTREFEVYKKFANFL